MGISPWIYQRLANANKEGLLLETQWNEQGRVPINRNKSHAIYVQVEEPQGKFIVHNLFSLEETKGANAANIKTHCVNC